MVHVDGRVSPPRSQNPSCTSRAILGIKKCVSMENAAIVRFETALVTLGAAFVRLLLCILRVKSSEGTKKQPGKRVVV